MLEGGYNLESISKSAGAVVETLLTEMKDDHEETFKEIQKHIEIKPENIKGFAELEKES